VIDFLTEYGMFAAKVITLIGVILAGLLFLAVSLGQRNRKEQESIDIEKINDKLEETQELLEKEIHSKDEFKKLKKEKKKKEKAEAKARKKSSDDAPTSRLFVLRFDGDIHASDVFSLRESISAVLSVATKDDEVLVVLDSSGGYVHNYGLAASQLHRFRQHDIPLTVCVDLVAASGGYLMACVANKILAAPFAIIGSIGVIGQVPNFNRLLKKHDIDFEQHTAGDFKRTLTVFGENTPKAREKFKEELEETHTLFKAFITEHRPQLDIEKVATGEHWYGKQALALHLVDELITSDDYLLAQSKDKDVYEVSYVVNETLVDKVSSLMHGVTARLSAFLKPSLLQ